MSGIKICGWTERNTDPNLISSRPATPSKTDFELLRKHPLLQRRLARQILAPVELSSHWADRTDLQEDERVPIGGLFRAYEASENARITLRNISKALSVAARSVIGFAHLLEIVSLPFDLLQALVISLQI